MNRQIKRKQLKWTHLWVLSGILAFSGCEMSRSVPLDPPNYKPQLVIQCLASPLSGAKALIRYNKPLREKDNGLIPPLPMMEAWLLMNGERIQAFVQDSADRFSIAADDLSLDPGNSYAMEVKDLTNDQTYISGTSQLPVQPGILSATAKRDSNYLADYALQIFLEEADRPVKAISVFPVLLDSLGHPVKRLSGGNNQKLTPWNKIQSNVEYNNTGTWSEKELLLRLNGGYLDDEDEFFYADHVDVFVVYLSEDLARFVRDLEDSYFSGEDIFQMVRPVYSNFQKAAGVFGLYNEVIVELEIEE